MKPYYSIHALALIFSLFMIACDSDYGMPEPYTPYMEDAPDYKSKVYINNQTLPINRYDFQATYREKKNRLEITGDSIFRFPVKITAPAEDRLVITCAVDEGFPDEYNERHDTRYISLPANYYVFEKSEVVVEKGAVESKDSISVRLNIDNTIKEVIDDVSLSIQIASVNNTKEHISSNLSRVSIFGTIAPVLDNVNSSVSAIEGERFNENIAFESSSYAHLLHFLNDGITSNFYRSWMTQSPDDYLSLGLPEEETIRGIIIYSMAGGYQIASLEVKADKGSKYINQGVAQFRQFGFFDEPILYIQFKTPVKTKSIRLDNFKNFGNEAQTHIQEIYLVR